MDGLRIIFLFMFIEKKNTHTHKKKKQKKQTFSQKFMEYFENIFSKGNLKKVSIFWAYDIKETVTF